MSGGSAAELDREAVIWHDVECAGYAADLPLWRRLAAERPGAVLELGAGTGRVALELAARGHELWALDAEPALVSELERRAAERGAGLHATVGDARAFAVVIAPMQVVQLLGGAEDRAAMLAAARRHLEPGGVLALALADPLEGLSEAEEPLPPLPDVRELDGWVYSSRPVSVRQDAGEIVIERIREAGAPDGALRTSEATIRLERLGAAELARQARALGYRELERSRVAATEAYVGSTVLVLEAV